MSAPDRAAIIAAYRAALDIAAADESLPLPYLDGSRFRIEFYLGAQDAPRRLAALEAAFTGAGSEPFASSVKKDGTAGERWVSTGSLAGVSVLISAPARDIAERKVTGTRTVEDVEWVRRPVEDENPESGETP